MAMRAKLVVASMLSAIVPGALYANPIATINPGDTVNVTATLTTTDPNENGEGEPIVIQANDGLSTKNIGVDFNYGIPQTFTYTAPPVLIAPGSPIPTTTISYYIQGADGDESASFATAINPNASPLTPAQKAQYASYAQTWGYIAAALGAGAGGCAFIPNPLASKACGAAGAVTAAGASALAVHYGKLASDPPDPNFMVIATPATVSIPPDVTVGVALTTDEYHGVALAEAILTSINRYQGAVAAGDTFWASQQLAAVNDYVSQLNALDGNLQADVQSFVDELKNLGLSGQLTAAQVLAFEQSIASGGLSSEAVSLLQQLGLTSTDIQSVTQDLFVQDINAVAGSYPTELDAFAAQLSVSNVPEPATFYLAGTGLAFLIIVRSRNSFGNATRRSSKSATGPLAIPADLPRHSTCAQEFLPV